MTDNEIIEFLKREPNDKPCKNPDPIHILAQGHELILCKNCHWDVIAEYHTGQYLPEYTHWKPAMPLHIIR